MRRGFTLVELMLTLGVLAVVAALAAPRLGMAGVRYRCDSVARRIAIDLEQARMSAIAGSVTRQVRFSTIQNRYSIPAVPSLDRRSTSTVVMLGESPYFAALLSADFGGELQVDFNGYGKPSRGGAVEVRVGDERRRVRVDALTGAVSIDRVRRSADNTAWVYDLLTTLSPLAPAETGGVITGVVGGRVVK